MSCDISDPAITETYQEIVSGAATNWMVMGYHESRDKISFYNSGTKGVEEMKTHLGDEVLYVFIRILGDRNILITYVSEQVSGVRRARALVHGRAIAALLKEFHAQFSASKLEELTESALASRLKSKELEGMADRVPLPQQQQHNNKEDGVGTKHVDGNSVRPGTPRSPSEESVHSMPSPLPSDSVDARANQARNELERKARVEAERLAREESELAAKEKAIQEETRRQERELQAKREMERTNRENLKREFALAEKSGKATFLSGYISHQLSDSGLWKRRWFVMKGKTLYLYKDEKDELPIDSISLGGAVVSIQDAHGEVLIPHSFKVEHKTNGNYYFYADNEPLKELAIAGLLKMAEEK